MSAVRRGRKKNEADTRPSGERPRRGGQRGGGRVGERRGRAARLVPHVPPRGSEAEDAVRRLNCLRGGLRQGRGRSRRGCWREKRRRTGGRETLKEGEQSKRTRTEKRRQASSAPAVRPLTWARQARPSRKQKKKWGRATMRLAGSWRGRSEQKQRGKEQRTTKTTNGNKRGQNKYNESWETSG